VFLKLALWPDKDNKISPERQPDTQRKNRFSSERSPDTPRKYVLLNVTLLSTCVFFLGVRTPNSEEICDDSIANVTFPFFFLEFIFQLRSSELFH
jgi:hypothetical protein